MWSHIYLFCREDLFTWFFEDSRASWQVRTCKHQPDRHSRRQVRPTKKYADGRQKGRVK